jgi:uncharacterized protein YdhG (YjbR/CyaY superfamily)
MTPRKSLPKSVGEYIDAAPKEARKKLREMRACVRKAAPGAKESILHNRTAPFHALRTE